VLKSSSAAVPMPPLNIARRHRRSAAMPRAAPLPLINAKPV
jgi:hypothetical protein